MPTTSPEQTVKGITAEELLKVYGPLCLVLDKVEVEWYAIGENLREEFELWLKAKRARLEYPNESRAGYFEASKLVGLSNLRFKDCWESYDKQPAIGV